MLLEIRPGTIDDILAVYRAIPEFVDPPGRAQYESRLLAARQHLILVAFDNGNPVGFKTGYERDADGSFYSWMGGVALTHRRFGIAQRLLETMQAWAVAQGYQTLRFKTRNHLKPMLMFGLKNGFHIYAVEPRASLEEYRILLQKNLKANPTL